MLLSDEYRQLVTNRGVQTPVHPNQHWLLLASALLTSGSVNTPHRPIYGDHNSTSAVLPSWQLHRPPVWSRPRIGIRRTTSEVDYVPEFTANGRHGHCGRWGRVVQVAAGADIRKTPRNKISLASRVHTHGRCGWEEWPVWCYGPYIQAGVVLWSLYTGWCGWCGVSADHWRRGCCIFTPLKLNLTLILTLTITLTITLTLLSSVRVSRVKVKMPIPEETWEWVWVPNYPYCIHSQWENVFQQLCKSKTSNLI